MKKSSLMKILAAIWIVLFCGLFIYFAFFINPDVTFIENENRNTAEKPDFSVENILSGNVDEQTESFLSDRMMFRSSIISKYNAIKEKLSFASYEDSLAVMGRTDDPLSEEEKELSEEEKQQLLEEIETEVHIGTKREKPLANIEDYPQSPALKMDIDGRAYNYYTWDIYNVLDITKVLNRVAACLPEDGELVYTMVPQAAAGNRCVNAKTSGTMHSEAEEIVDAFGAANVQAVCATDVLSDMIQNGDYTFFRSDMHWTPLGTYNVYAEMVSKAGLTAVPLEEYTHETEYPFLGTYYRDNPKDYMKENPDTLDLYKPSCNLQWLRCTAPDTYKEIDFWNMKAKSNDRYTVYLGGPAGPWTYAECDNDKDRNCLVICDSFGLAYVPFVSANYKQTHYLDPRYYDHDKVGYTVKEMIEKYNISDVYVVIGDLHAYGTGFITSQLSRQIGD